MKMCEGCKGNCRTCDKPFIDRNITVDKIITETEEFSLKAIIYVCVAVCVVLGIVSMFIKG